jgi:hypothetical protein
MAYTDREDLNYLGKLFQIGANQTPFLNMIGGLSGGGKTTHSFNFPVAQPWALAGASQSATSEALAAAAGTATTYTRGQDYNTVQIMKKDYGSTFAKQSTFGEISGLSIIGDQPVKDELAFQKMAALKQMAIDVDYSFIRGVYAAQSVATTGATTRGIVAATTTNEVAAGTAALTKAMIDQIVRTMATNGAIFGNMVMFCGAFQKQKISDLYGYAPESRNVGGVNIQQIETDFCQIGVVWTPHIAADDIIIADMSVCYPVFCPYKGQVIVDVPIALTAALEGGFLYTQIGLDYGPEEFHGKITDLATS